MAAGSGTKEGFRLGWNGERFLRTGRLRTLRVRLKEGKGRLRMVQDIAGSKGNTMESFNEEVGLRNGKGE